MDPYGNNQQPVLLAVASAGKNSCVLKEAMANKNKQMIILESSNSALTNTHSFLISSLTLIILLFFIKPSIILNSTQLLSLSLFYI
jgi:NADH-ubiquinone oxidoreductase chain 2